MPNIQPTDYETLKYQFKILLTKGREKAYSLVNSVLVETYGDVGKYIIEFEQKGDVKAEYGKELLNKLAKDLILEYGKGFSRSNLFQMRAFYIKLPKIQMLSDKLSWSHYFELLKIDNELERNFFLIKLGINY